MDTQKRKERERASRKERILDGAVELMEEHGFEKTTMDDIAARADISKGSLYLYFKDKDTLFLAVKKRGLNTIINNFMSFIHRDEEGAIILKKMILSFIEFTTTHQSFTRAMIRYEQQIDDSKEENIIAKECDELTTEIFMLIVRVLQIGKQDGSIKIDMPSKLLAMIIGLQMNGILQFVLKGTEQKGQTILNEFGITLPQLLEQFLDLQFTNTNNLNEK